MLTVDEKEVIRRDYFIHRKSMRQITRDRHHSRKTIRKALYGPGVPVYTRSKPAPKVAIGPFCGGDPAVVAGRQAAAG